MKKILSLIISLMLILSCATTAFAGVTIEHTFIGDDGFIYHFGKITDLVNPFDAGIKIGDNFYSLNKEDAKVQDANALERALSSGLWGIGIKDTADVLGSSYEVKPYSKADENSEAVYYTAQTVTKSEVNEFPKVTLSNDTSITELKINGIDADAVSGTTYYVAVADLDDYEGQITATATDANATVNVSPITNNQATVTVTAEDGVTKGEYTVKFKEMVEKKLDWQPVEGISQGQTIYGCLYLQKKSDGTYSTGLRYADNNNWYTARYDQNLVMYIQYSTNTLPANSKIVRTANISGTAVRNSLYQFYNTHYETIDKTTCTFDEFTNGDAKFLCEFQRTNATGSDMSLTFNSSMIDIKPNGYIHIALVDGDSSGVSMFQEVPTLTINYITLD